MQVCEGGGHADLPTTCRNRPPRTKPPSLAIRGLSDGEACQEPRASTDTGVTERSWAGWGRTRGPPLWPNLWLPGCCPKGKDNPLPLLLPSEPTRQGLLTGPAPGGSTLGAELALWAGSPLGGGGEQAGRAPPTRPVRVCPAWEDAGPDVHPRGSFFHLFKGCENDSF